MALQGDDNWSPPSESDMKILRARQERQDKVSRLMGDYLLKGYRMLGDSCDICGTILLQDRQKKLLCISCQELDSDTEKDNPELPKLYNGRRHHHFNQAGTCTTSGMSRGLHVAPGNLACTMGPPEAGEVRQIRTWKKVKKNILRCEKLQKQQINGQ
ncbi:protein ZNRD2 isoform X2 [Rana temporaria]|uniref:protein ZNRD2 isoform X2 n=1 Tax=Rana temporaria TaxID=8407 RepID=UPI001AADE000|nr:protein ZNRD2 isoform X2 [Rana temporaria]